MKINRTYRGITLMTATLSLMGSASAQVIRAFPFAPLHRTSAPVGNITMNTGARFYTLTGRPGLLDCGNSNLAMQIETSTKRIWWPPSSGSYGIHTMNYVKTGAASIPGLLNPSDTRASYLTFSELSKKRIFPLVGTQVNNQNTWRVPNAASIEAQPVNMREANSLPCADIAIDAWLGNPFGSGIRDPYYVLVDAAGNVISPTLCSLIRLPAPAGFVECRRLVLPLGMAAGSYNVLVFIQGHLVEKVNGLAFRLTASGSRGRTPVTPLHFRWGDANGDNIIDQIDEDVVTSMVATRTSLDTTSPFCEGEPGLGLGRSAIEFEYNGDGIVDLSDLVILWQNSGQIGDPGWPKQL